MFDEARERLQAERDFEADRGTAWEMMIDDPERLAQLLIRDAGLHEDADD